MDSEEHSGKIMVYERQSYGSNHKCRHRDCSNVATFSDKIHFGPNGPRAAEDGRN